MLLTNITFSGGQSVALTPVTIIIGPNNAGKSRALREVLAEFQPGFQEKRVISSIEITPPTSWQELSDALNLHMVRADNGNTYGTALMPLLNALNQVNIGTPQGHPAFYPAHNYMSSFGNASIAYLGTGQRLQLFGTSPIVSPPPVGQPTNLVQFLFHRRELEETINAEVFREFNTRIHVDHSSLMQLVVRVGKDVHLLPTDPFTAAEISNNYETIEQQGDGIRSFVATVATSIIARRPITLIDEPETSLHPPQAFALGRFFGKTYSDRHQLLSTTHSADVLRGALSTTSNLSLIRLTRNGDKNDATPISAADLREISNDPLLNATSILDAVFFSAAVVTEADADRAFYEEISSKMEPASSIKFASVQGKHTLPRAIKAYRKMGVPFAAIADMDALREEQAFQALVESATDDPGLRQAAIAARVNFLASLKQPTLDEQLIEISGLIRQASAQLDADLSPKAKVTSISRIAPRLTRTLDAWKRLKAGGTANMNEDELAAFNAVDSKLSKFGVFLVPVGELEWWLTEVGIPGTTDKRGWISTALQQARSLVPQSGFGPWLFLSRIHKFLNIS